MPLLNDGDVAYGPDDLVRLAQGVDGVLTCGTERWTPAVIERLPDRLRIVASFSVGYEHLDLPAFAKRGIVATNTPDVLTEATADVAMLCLLGAARRAWESQMLLRERRWDRAENGRAAGSGSARPRAGHRRHGAYRAGDRPTGARFRHDHPLPQPSAAAGREGGRRGVP